MDFPSQQKTALQLVQRWLQGGDQQVFRLFGYAGTGKTTLAKYLAEGVEGEVYFAAFTGKATYVLRQKGCRNPATIHKLIYTPRDKSRAHLRQLEEELEKLALDDPKRLELAKRIEEEQENLTRPMFTLNLDSPLKQAKLLVLDEVSMIDEQMGRDLESFGCKILALGDPAQLPPIYGEGHFTRQRPDFLLTEIHRQARDNPIIDLATCIRDECYPAPGQYGSSRVIRKMDAGMALEADQLLVGRNETRVGFNRRVRELRGWTEPLPRVGDKLVCLRNSREHPLLNGSTWSLNDFEDVSHDRVLLGVADADTSVTCLAHKAYFYGDKPAWYERNEAEEFDYGYALTTHKAQGSQWDNVLIYDESRAFRADRWKWLYTAVTRAAERCTIVLT